MKIQGGNYIFKTHQRVNQEHNYKAVEVINAGILVSLVVAEDGSRFAAFNTDLSRDTKVIDSSEGW